LPGADARTEGIIFTHDDKCGRILELPVFGSVAEAMDKIGAATGHSKKRIKIGIERKLPLGVYNRARCFN
jgi:hypothetical protein